MEDINLEVEEVNVTLCNLILQKLKLDDNTFFEYGQLLFFGRFDDALVQHKKDSKL